MAIKVRFKKLLTRGRESSGKAQEKSMSAEDEARYDACEMVGQKGDSVHVILQPVACSRIASPHCDAKSNKHVAHSL